MSFFWSTLLLVTTAATAHKEFSYDIMLLVATGATARKEFGYDVIFFGVPCYWLLQVLQLARSLSMTSFFLEYLATGCYRCYSSQGV